MLYKCIPKPDWDKTVEQLTSSCHIFASVENEYGLDYELIGPGDALKISYNKPRPATSLKSFFLPVKENVTIEKIDEKPRIIIGIPNCDVESMSLPDEIYLDPEYTDPYYKRRRENTLLIATDCFGIRDHCHCLSYNIKPYSENHADLSVINHNELIILRILSVKGDEFANKIAAAPLSENSSIPSFIENEHHTTGEILKSSNAGLPDYRETGELVQDSGEETWEKYSSKCVSCGACTTICPTCSCFLLIDKPAFQKIKQMDTCQYPGFERVAGGEDALFERHKRFKNRYMCKYVWKPQKFTSIACTGCGRCITACIGKINKNEIFMELSK